MAGTGVTFTFSADFPEAELKQEIVSALKEIEPKIAIAMASVAEDAKDALVNHIKSEVYAKWSPSTYERRMEGGGLIDRDSSMRTTTSSGEMTLRYIPSGESAQWQNPAHGDALIGRIESGGGYEWYPHPGARPFWESFVNEMVDGRFAQSFDAAMSMQFGTDYEGASTVEREAGDSDY